MAGRLPFNLPNHTGQNPLHDPQIRAALGLGPLDDSLYLQHQRDFQRDLHLRQLLLQDQLDQQSRLDSIVVEQRLKQLREQFQEFPELQQHYAPLLLHDRFHREQEESNLFARAQLQQHEELQRRNLTQGQSQAQQHSPIGQYVPQIQASGQRQGDMNAQEAASKASSLQSNAIRDIAADSLAGNAVKRSDMEKRVFAKPEEGNVPAAGAKKRPRASTEDSGDSGRKKGKKKKEKFSKKNFEGLNALGELGKVASEASKQPTGRPGSHKQSPKPSALKSPPTSKQSAMKPSAQALLDFATSRETRPATLGTPTASHAQRTLGTFGDLLDAAKSEEKTDEAALVLTNIKSADAIWADSDRDYQEVESKRAIQRGDTIQLPNFKSILPQLPEEPEIVIPLTSSDKKKRKKFRGLLDDDSVDTKSNVKAKEDKKDVVEPQAHQKPADTVVVDYPYPIDTWWPSVQSVRKERKANGEPQDEDNFDDEEEGVLDATVPFRANMPRLKEKLTHDVAPGVLEKLPHCRIHRMLMRKRKNAAAPEFVYCFQVTELYPNDIMVCCSHCGTWRHTACGGHYKPYSVRECIDAPFTAICDRCHVEERILRDFPVAKKRVDRQRNEQIRRGLATSAAMRQASFSKHGGTYKWPLGSVSATHIGGHTRSVWHRHDKADKQWMDMAQRLSKSHGFRLKERIKVRTKELERLLVSVEDAEGHTDRHNMMLFLLQDTIRDAPVGFEKRRRNLFDPEEDDVVVDPADPLLTMNGTHPNPQQQQPKTTTKPGGDDSKVDDSVSAVESFTDKGERGDDESNENENEHDIDDDGAGDEDDEEEDDDDDDDDDDDTTDNESMDKRQTNVCAKQDCHNKPRFDSIFCSDACGVACLESDLLRTFHYTSDIHPSLLRS